MHFSIWLYRNKQMESRSLIQHVTLRCACYWDTTAGNAILNYVPFSYCYSPAVVEGWWSVYRLPTVKDARTPHLVPGVCAIIMWSRIFVLFASRSLFSAPSVENRRVLKADVQFIDSCWQSVTLSVIAATTSCHYPALKMLVLLIPLVRDRSLYSIPNLITIQVATIPVGKFYYF